ncbi:MAG: glycosyltransferase family 39 protein [Chloroflexota bacterium]
MSTPGVARTLASVPLLLAGLALAITTQYTVMQRAVASDTALRFTFAAAAFAGGLALSRRTGTLRWPEQRLFERPAHRDDDIWHVSRSALVAAFALGAITFASNGGNSFTPLGVAAWCGSVIAGMIAFWPAPRLRDTWARVRRTYDTWRATATGARLIPRMTWVGAGVILATLLGTWLLFHRLDETPPEMTSDNAEMMLDLQDVLDGSRPIFFPRNAGREPLHFYFNALLAPYIGGVSERSIKVATALPAILTVPATFLLGRLLFGAPVGLVAAALAGTSRWHLIVGRWGERTSYLPGGAALLAFLLLRGLRERRRTDFLLAGLALGVLQHTYLPARIAPLGVLACCGIALADDAWRRAPRVRMMRLLVNVAALFFIATLVFMPLARFGYDNPQSFLFRGLSRVTGDAGGPAVNLLIALLVNTRNAALMFNWRGDIAWVNNISGERVLDPLSGALFLLGLVYVLYRLIRFHEVAFLYVPVLLLIGLVPSIISVAFPAENPGNLRTGMAMPFAMLLAALPLVIIARRIRVWVGGRIGGGMAGIFVAALLVPIIGTNYDQYFRIYHEQFARSSQHTSYVSRAVLGFVALGGVREDVHIMVWPHWFDLRLVAASAGNVRWDPGIRSIDEALSKDGVARLRLYIVHPDDAQSLQKLRSWYPGGIEHTRALWELGGRPWFVTYILPPGARAAL